jgi:NAD(P)H-hydrate repair Nnr-like enzyme with NAD(P)H-hydrate epimerase domain
MSFKILTLLYRHLAIPIALRNKLDTTDLLKYLDVIVDAMFNYGLKPEKKKKFAQKFDTGSAEYRAKIAEQYGEMAYCIYFADRELGNLI